MNLVAKTYWLGTPFAMRRLPGDYAVESLVLKAADGREHRGLLWTSRKARKPKTGAVVMHPRADFQHHYVVPRLVEAGIAVLAATTRNPNNDTTTVHEEIILDVGSCIAELKRRGVQNVVLIGNSGGGALNGFYQSQAVTPKGQRIATTPGGRPTRLNQVDMIPADAMIYLAAHKGEGMIMNEVIDPSVVDEADPHATDPTLDMYDEANGFLTPTALDGSDAQWSRYDDAFVTRYRAAQRARVARLDAIARALITDNERAEQLHADPDFVKLPAARRRDILRREAFEPIMTVYRTMANLHYVDNHLDPSPRDYGSILSPRSDLMNWKLLGFGRYATPHAWLSTWSGLSSHANQMTDLPKITAPTLFINAGKDQEIFPATDARPMFEVVAAPDKTFLEFPDAQHYFNPPFGQKAAPDVETVMNAVVPWILERFGV
jgi:pimeloyl-ACP methyl ester carboxylesterase